MRMLLSPKGDGDQGGGGGGQQQEPTIGDLVKGLFQQKKHIERLTEENKSLRADLEALGGGGSTSGKGSGGKKGGGKSGGGSFLDFVPFGRCLVEEQQSTEEEES